MGFRYSAMYSMFIVSLSVNDELSDWTFFTNRKKKSQAFVRWLGVLDSSRQSRFSAVFQNVDSFA